MDTEEPDNNLLGKLDDAQSLEELLFAIESLQSNLHGKIAHLLAQEEGREFASFEDKQKFIAPIKNILRFASMEILCPKCNGRATLRVAKSGNPKEGVFQFVHVSPKRTVHGGTIRLPKLIVVPKGTTTNK